MITLAKITAVAILIIGIVMVVVGIAASVMGFGGVLAPQRPFLPLAPFFTLQPAYNLGLVIGLALFAQGLVVSALGEALYLLADISANTLETRRMLLRSLATPVISGQNVAPNSPVEPGATL